MSAASAMGSGGELRTRLRQGPGCGRREECSGWRRHRLHKGIVSSFYIAVAADDDSTGGSGQHAGVGIGGGEFGEEVPVFQEKEVPGPFVFCAGRAHPGVQECV